MKKFISITMLAALFMLPLQGCAEQESTDVTPTEVYLNEDIGFRFNYPSHYDIQVYDEEEGVLRATIGKDIIFTIERSDYFMLLLEMEDPTGKFGLRNACEHSDLEPFLKDCYGITEGIPNNMKVVSYLEVTKTGPESVGFQKTYYIETPHEDWWKAAFAVNLFTEEDEDRYETPGVEMLETELSDSQKERIKTVERIVKSMQFN